MIWTFICGDLEKTINFPHLLSPGFMVPKISICFISVHFAFVILMISFPVMLSPRLCYSARVCWLSS